MTRTRMSIALPMLLLLACHNATPTSKKDEGTGLNAAPTRSSTAAQTARRTTSAAIAVRNVNSKLRQLEDALRSSPNDLATMKSLTGMLMLRSSQLGQIGGLDRVAALGEQAVTIHPKLPEAWLLRAKAKGAVHAFSDALKDLDQAERLGADDDKVSAARSHLLVALGRYDEGIAMMRARRKLLGDSFETLMAEGMALGRMSQFEKADALLVQALEKYHGVSPFPVAQVAFERGSMWDRAGDGKRAEPLYRSAVARLPMYAHAAEHLAYKVPYEEAMKLVAGLIKTSDDPQYHGTLALLMNAKHAGSGQPHLEKAKRGYEALLAKHALAFADHAGWFYLTIAKDDERAVKVARINLDNRPTPEAFELLLAALVGAKQGLEACKVADKSLALKYPARGMLSQAAEAFELCDRKSEAQKLRQRLQRPAAGSK